MPKLRELDLDFLGGSDHELLIAKFRLKLKKVGKTIGEGNGNPLQYSCLENPMDGGAW